MRLSLARTLVLALFALAFFGAGIVAWVAASRSDDSVVCAMDVRLCPDGSSVGRTGLRCEFAECRDAAASDWRTEADPESGIVIRYPEELGTSYVRTATWPPHITRANGPYACLEKEGTEERMVNGHAYCITETNEGAAGSRYADYTYRFPTEDGKVATLSFALRYVECANYPEAEQAACTEERRIFDPDALADHIAQSAEGI